MKFSLKKIKIITLIKPNSKNMKNNLKINKCEIRQKQINQ